MAEYIPSPRQWVRDQVELYEKSGGTEGTTLRDTGLPVIIVTHRGNKSGAIRKTPLMKVKDGASYVLVGSVGGAPQNPVWVYNLRANPSVEIRDLRHTPSRREPEGGAMPSIVAQLINRPLTADGPITRLFRAAGAHDFPAAALHVLRLPYGRITDRSRFWLVVEEGRGTCTTKHATLAELAREQDIDVQLMLGIYEMSERNTPGVGRVLTAHGLSYIPEAHCYLRCQGERVDMTGIPPGAAPIERFLHEEPITVDQIGAYKNDLHRRFLRDWITRTEAVHGRSLDDVWQIREECIAALGGGVYATPSR